MLANACTQQEADAAAAMPAVFVFQQAHAHLALVLRDFVTANTTAGTAGSLVFPLCSIKKVAQRRISRCCVAIRGRQSADHLPASRCPRCDGTYRPPLGPPLPLIVRQPQHCQCYLRPLQGIALVLGSGGAGPVVPSQCRTYAATPPGSVRLRRFGQETAYSRDAVFNRCRIN